MRRGRRALIEHSLPPREIILGDLHEVAAPIDPASFFPAVPRAIWLEVGFGAGEHLAWQAARHPDVGFIGCEPFLNGVASLLARLEAESIDNVRIFREDARLLMAGLAPASIERAFILFPDPWPKKRHHKRRFITAANLDRLAKIMRAGGEMRIATDDVGYLRWILRVCLSHAAFTWRVAGPHDWRARPDDWPPSRYEEKAIDQGRQPAYLRFIRRGGRLDGPGV